MGSKPLWAVTIAMAFALSTFYSRYPVAWASQAVCNRGGWQWKANSLGQDPCAFGSILQAACRDNGPYSIRPLNGPDDAYGPPKKSTDLTTGVNATLDFFCECDTVTYMIFMACTHCQSGTILSWAVWTADCPAITTMQYPHRIPQGTAIPRWAFYNILGTPGETYDDTAAMAIGRDPEEKSHNSGNKGRVGAIAGGVVGSVALITLSAVVVIRRRRRRRGNQPYPRETSGDIEEESPGPSTANANSPPLPYYNLNDPTTFPPPMEEIQNPVGHVGPRVSHGQDRSSYPGLPEV